MKNSIIIVLLILATNLSNAQSNPNMITRNIQSHLLNKKWGLKPNDSNSIRFWFKENQLLAYRNTINFANSDYYITDIDCSINNIPFEVSKIGSLSTGNIIKTRSLCYVVEFYENLSQFRIKTVNSKDWKIYYLIN